MLDPLRETFLQHQHPNLLVGLGVADDAAVYKLNSEQAIVSTIDFFGPVVDDAYTFGAIAAVNALSDVYAMGGEPLLALNVAAFPADMPSEIAREILRGGADKIAEAGAVLAGGHTMEDKEPKYGLAVTGLVHPEQVITKAGAQPGDALVLTKPLGIGIITTALKAGLAEVEHVQSAVETMLQLNRCAARLMQRVGVHAATDITGFGLLGHAQEMARYSGVGLRIRFADVPFLAGARQYAEDWLFPGGAQANQSYFGVHVTFTANLDEEEKTLLFDPVTSGGLLIAIPPGQVDKFKALCAEEGQDCWIIGEVVTGAGGIEVV